MDELSTAWQQGSASAYLSLDTSVVGEDRGSWAVGVLLAAIHASDRRDCAASQLETIVDIGLDSNRWSEAHEAFSALRQVTMRYEREGGERVCRLLVDVGESAAKVIYNAGGNPAPFDADSGIRLIARAQALAAHLGSHDAADMLWHAVGRVPTQPSG